MSELMSSDAYEKPGNLDQVRDLIFGPQLRDYNRRFEKIESDLSAFREETRDRIDGVKEIISRELRVAVESLEKKIKSLSATTQEEWSDLRQQLERTDKKFSNSLEALDSEVDASTMSLREEISQTRGKLQEDMRNLRAQIHEELDKRLSVLGDVKISRDEMAEILVELGMRLRGVESLPEPVVRFKEPETIPALREAARPEPHNE